MGTSMTISDYVMLKEAERDQSSGWSSSTALWVIVAVIILFAIVYNWTKNCNEKVQFATSLANLNGRVSCLEPDVRWLGTQMYGVAQTAAGIVTGVRDIKDDVSALNKTVYTCPIDDLTARFIVPSQAGCGCSRGGREFKETNTYTLASNAVTVTDTCRG